MFAIFPSVIRQLTDRFIILCVSSQTRSFHSRMFKCGIAQTVTKPQKRFKWHIIIIIVTEGSDFNTMATDQHIEEKKLVNTRKDYDRQKSHRQ